MFATRTAGDPQARAEDNDSEPQASQPERPTSAQRAIRPLNIQTETELPETPIRPASRQTRFPLVPQSSQLNTQPPDPSQSNRNGSHVEPTPESSFQQPELHVDPPPPARQPASSVFDRPAVDIFNRLNESAGDDDSDDDDDDDDFVDATPPQ